MFITPDKSTIFIGFYEKKEVKQFSVKLMKEIKNYKNITANAIQSITS